MRRDLGLESVGAITDEIAAVASAYAGVTAAAVEAKDARDGLVVPIASEDGRPETMAVTAAAAAEPPALDQYSLRLVATRKLYDRGVAVEHAEWLAKLAPGTIVRVNPYDFDRLGIDDGARVSACGRRVARWPARSAPMPASRGAAWPSSSTSPGSRRRP